ncbi:uncharacterized protein LOC132256007 [Phlebotomus argentipes]|uniref:uncharacterized protein LOC132256007 n=1 Tax=Phlebotomus argentipes TaxID=94469 RepID=UPI002892AADE|nr:uncharacterized protein LOC132256007 [Phlebotomus argentipes]
MVLEIPDRASRSLPGLSTIAVESLPGSLQTSEEDGDFDRISSASLNGDTSEPTSAILSICKRQFVSPYVHILGIAGLRPRNIDSHDSLTTLGHVQSALILAILLASYSLQYLCGFRRDRGFTTREASWTARRLQHVTEAVFIYAIPSLLHLLAFLAALTVFRVVANEQLQSLIERVFISSHFPRRLVAWCWTYKLSALAWLLGTTSFVIFTTGNQSATTEWFTKLSGTSQIAFTVITRRSLSLKRRYLHLPVALRDFSKDFLIKYRSKARFRIKYSCVTANSTSIFTNMSVILNFARLLAAALFFQDFLQGIVLSSYAVQCFLLRHFLQRVRERLLENTIDSLEWMREMTEFQKLLEHLNLLMSPPVSLFVLLNAIYCISGTLHLASKLDLAGAPEESLLGLMNVTLWLLAALLPLHQAASLTTKCQEIQSCGHEIRIRPFLHHRTSTDDLNSVLIYASSLRMSAKLLRMPIRGGHLCGLLLLGAVTLITLGMCGP